MPIIKNCELCTRAFLTKPSLDKRFCNRECYEKFRIFSRLFICDFCDTLFIIKKGDHRKPSTHNFCNHTCRGEWQKEENNHAWRGVKEKRFCVICNKEFVVKTEKEKKSKNCCGRTCKSIFYKNNLHPLSKPTFDECNFCKQTIKILNCEIGKRNFCDRDCANSGHSIFIRGENNGRYINGEANMGYPTDWNKKFKNLIRERDGNICKLCNMTEIEHGKLLCVHHIDGNKENLDELNMITLCRFCHGKMHGKGANREQWKEKLLNLLN